MPVVEGPYQNFSGVQFPLGWEIIREHNWPGNGAEAYVELFPQAPVLLTSFFSPTHRFEFITDPKCGGASQGHHYVYMRRVLPPTPTGWQITVDSRGIGSRYTNVPQDGRASAGPDCFLWLNGEPTDEDDVETAPIFRRLIAVGGGTTEDAPTCETTYLPIGGSSGEGLPVDVDISPRGGNLDLLVNSTLNWNYANGADTQVNSGWPILDIYENPAARLAYLPDTFGEFVTDKGARPGAFLELDIRIRRKPGKTVTP